MNRKYLLIGIVIIAIILISSITTFFILPNYSPSTNTATNVVVDHLGRTVEIPAHPQRVVSLHPISTQIVYTLDAQSQLTAIDQSSRTNKILQRIDPAVVNITGVIGDINKPNVEEILQLNPDLVIVAAYYPESAKALADAGLTVIAFNFHTRPTIDSIQLIGRALGRQAEANTLVDYFVKKESVITTRTANIPRSERPTVLYLSTSAGPGVTSVWTTCGNQAFQHTLISRAGGINIGENMTGIWFTESSEQIMEWNPEYIFTGGVITGQAPPVTLQMLTNDTVLNQLDAINKGHFYYMVRLEFNTFTNCPESILGLEIMAKNLYPDTFADINLNSDVKEFFSTFYHCELSDTEVATYLNPT